MKFKNFLINYWGDIICAMLFIITGIIIYQMAIGQYVYDRYVPILLIACAIFFLVALIHILKKRKLRNWLYLIYAVLFSLIMFFFMISSIPHYSTAGETFAIFIFEITILFTLILSIVRIGIWLYKRHQAKKAEANHDTNE